MYTSCYCRRDLLLNSLSLNKHINAVCMISLLILCALLALGEPVNCLWLWSSWIWVWNIHIPKWRVQLWSDHVRTFDWPSVPRQVRMDKVIIRVFQSYVSHFSSVIICNILNRTRQRGEQFLARWAIPQLHDIDALSSMVDPSLNGNYPAKSLSNFADIISRCLQVIFIYVNFKFQLLLPYSMELIFCLECM